MLAILHSAFWFTYVTLQIHDLFQQKTEDLDAQLLGDMLLLGNIFVILFVSTLLLYGNLTQRLTFYWIYLVVNCMIMFTLGPTFSFVPFPAELASTQAMIFGASTLFQFISLIVIWLAAKESVKPVDCEKGAILSADQLKTVEKDPTTLKF
jgi:hypothetical protein